MPALEALLDRLDKANTQALGVSVDSVYAHANWGKSLGGVSFPLLADFHPKGEMAASLGVYLAKFGITDRATIIIDADGVVQHASSVTPAGKRDIAEIVTLCEQINDQHDGALPAPERPDGLDSQSVLYVKNSCGFSRAVLLARDNLHLGDDVLPVRNVSEDDAAMAELEAATGKKQAPCLLVGKAVLLESKDIIAHLVSRTTSLSPAE